MKDWKMYTEIQKLKSLGYKKTKAARKLEINFRTINKYWDMTLEQYSAQCEEAKLRVKKADDYRDDLLNWIMVNPDINTAQLFDWLEEMYGDDITFTERTLRTYVCELRRANNIPKTLGFRQYEAVEDLPMGYQSQVDMGQIWVKDTDGKRMCLYCFAMVLSRSRYKFVYWITRPFTTATFIDAHEKAFAFFGGRTDEIVYDQDKVLAVSENSGDIIYTEAFQNYISIMKFKMYLCRGADPESKGRVEAVVKYAKYNFADHRTFTNIDNFNAECLSWLERRGNGKEHNTTKKIPAEVFTLEKDYLQPVPLFRKISLEESVAYIVRKDNTVLYKSNRYRVPKGTYRPGLKVKLSIDESSMCISDTVTGEIYARHTISVERGKLITLPHSDRELNKKLKEVHEQTLSYFNNKEQSSSFLNEIKQLKPRYFKDQLNVITKSCEEAESNEIINNALTYCIKYKLYSASEFNSAIDYYTELSRQVKRETPRPLPQLPSKYKMANPKVRDISEYRKAMEG